MTIDTVTPVRTLDYIAALKLSNEVVDLLLAIGTGHVVDQAAINAARALSLSLSRRLRRMKAGPPTCGAMKRCR